MLIRISILTVLLSFMSLSAPAAHADGDAQAGRKKAETCIGCHGIEGYKNTYPTYRVPKLKGQHGAYIALALKAYRTGERTHPTMRSQAGTLSDQDIADIAAYIDSLK
ncbi:MAG: cytochrome c [Gammaproteobacteria bacterium]